ncbi:unnamed protein product, partial [Chrysoparadoxa australica]
MWLALVTLVLGLVVSIVNAASVEECTSLYEAYEAFNGQDWVQSDGWSSAEFDGQGRVSDNCCSWFGVFCVFANSGSITGVSLHSNNLSGPIPKSLFQGLTSLEWVNLDRNKLSDHIPKGLFQGLTELFNVYLWNNQLSGPIPKGLFQDLTSLDDVSLSGNLLRGDIPEDLLRGSNSLRRVSLDYNQLSGP